MTKHKLDILVVGEIHRDPVTYDMLEPLFLTLKEKKIPIVLCEEEPSTITRAEIEQKMQSFSKAYKEFQGDPAFAPYVSRVPHLTRSFVPLSSQRSLIESLSLKFANMDYARAASREFIRAEAVLRQVAFSEAVPHSHYSYYGIDDHLATVLQAHNMESLELEKQRLQGMSSRIKDAIDKMDSTKPAVLIVVVGIIHARQLGIYLQKILDLPACPFDFTISVVQPHSLYVADEYPLSCALVEKRSKELGIDLNQMPFYDMAFSEKPDGRFESKEWDALFTKLVTKEEHYPIIIPACNDEKKSVLRSKKIPFTEESDGSVTILSHWQALRSDKEKLGIGAVKVTCDEREKQEEALKSIPGVTVVKEASSKLFVIYPIVEREKVSRIANDWDAYKQESEVSTKLSKLSLQPHHSTSTKNPAIITPH